MQGAIAEGSNGSVVKIFRSDNLGVSFSEIYSTPLQSENAYDIWTDRYELSDLFFLDNGNVNTISTSNNDIEFI